MGADSKNDGFDADGLRERADFRESDARRRERDNVEKRKEEDTRDQVRADFREGRMSKEDFARLAREAGISVREVAATLREHRPVEAAPPASAPSLAAAAALATASAAKAQGVEELKRGETAEAAATFSRAAELAAAAVREAGDGAGTEALRLQAAAELNAALCLLKLSEWEAAAAASTRALAAAEGDAGASTKALFRRAKALLAQPGRRAAALRDLRRAARLSPQEAEVRRELARLEAEVAAEARARAEAEVPSPAPAPPPAESVAAAPPEGEAEAGGEAAAAAERLAPEARSYCFLELSIGGRAAGRLSFELFDDLVPRTARNFRQLCCGVREGGGGGAGESGEGEGGAGGSGGAGAGGEVGEGWLCYRGSAIHRIVPGFVVQGGDITAGDGSGGRSTYGGDGALEDESFAVRHARPGLLSMANKGPHTATSQWFVTLNPAPMLDGTPARVDSRLPCGRRTAPFRPPGGLLGPLESVRGPRALASGCPSDAASPTLLPDQASTSPSAGCCGACRCCAGWRRWASTRPSGPRCAWRWSTAASSHPPRWRRRRRASTRAAARAARSTWAGRRCSGPRRTATRARRARCWRRA